MVFARLVQNLPIKILKVTLNPSFLITVSMTVFCLPQLSDVGYGQGGLSGYGTARGPFPTALAIIWQYEQTSVEVGCPQVVQG